MAVSCPFCQRESSLRFIIRDLNRGLSEENFSYYRCHACGLIFLSPVPNDLGKYYPPEYYCIPDSLAHLASVVEPERYKIEMIQGFISGGRLLEIGPAVGSFVYLAKQAGFEVEALEMDARCCEFLTNVVGVRVINSSDIGTALEASEPFHVIALWHVIEHLPDPLETLAAVAHRLLPGGIAVIAAPNPAAFQFRVLGRIWTHLDAPRHLVLMPVPLLVRCAEKLGLKPVLITTRDRGTLAWNEFGWRESLGNFFTRRTTKRIANKVGSLLTMLLRPIERRELRGSTYTVIFQKGLQ